MRELKEIIEEVLLFVIVNNSDNTILGAGTQN